MVLQGKEQEVSRILSSCAHRKSRPLHSPVTLTLPPGLLSAGEDAVTLLVVLKVSRFAPELHALFMSETENSELYPLN